MQVNAHTRTLDPPPLPILPTYTPEGLVTQVVLDLLGPLGAPQEDSQQLCRTLQCEQQTRRGDI